mmetsp:Transcript_16361/g.53263  ORF Transcript_16361/g.53263 Transcript_16361/m.53263 type:complete len:264 (+) Transcript_16361:714-1505(+)
MTNVPWSPKCRGSVTVSPEYSPSTPISCILVPPPCQAGVLAAATDRGVQSPEPGSRSRCRGSEKMSDSLQVCCSASGQKISSAVALCCTKLKARLSARAHSAPLSTTKSLSTAAAGGLGGLMLDQGIMSLGHGFAGALDPDVATGRTTSGAVASVAAGALSLGNWLARAAARCCGLSAMALLVAERRASCSLRFALAMCRAASASASAASRAAIPASRSRRASLVSRSSASPRAADAILSAASASLATILSSACCTAASRCAS